jgi:hypothetical protein
MLLRFSKEEVTSRLQLRKKIIPANRAMAAR